MMDLPDRIKRLPVDPQRGLPVPWFVAWIDGKPDFRVLGADKFHDVVKFKRCWICGQELGRNVSFVLGSMCSVTRTSPEPPSHRECAIYSAVTCPFLTKPHMRRRTDHLPEDHVPAPGCPILRNPAVALVWTTRTWKLIDGRAEAAGKGNRGALVRVGEPTETLWYCEGRTALRAEIEAAIESGLPLLYDADRGSPHEAEAHAELAQMVADARKYLPAV
jgi:hypothetical protein